MPPTVARTSATSRAPRRTRRAGVALLSLALVLTIPACDAAIGPLLAPDRSALQLGGDDPLSNKSVVVAPTEVTLNAIGRSRQLSVTVRNGAGRLVVNPNVTWTSSNPEVATVNASGLIQSVGVGTVLITAAAMGNADTATVQVRQVVAAVAVAPDTATVEVSGTHTFAVIAADSNGVAIPEVSVTWSSSDPAAAIVMANGEATGVAPGTATIAATADVGGNPIVGSAQLTVVPAGSQPPPPPPPPGVASVTITPASATIQNDSTVQLTAAALDADGNTLERTFTWTSATPATATVSPSGLVTAVSAGVVGIMAEADGVGGVSIITVQAPAPPAPPPPPPPGGYSPNTPHWSHIRLEVTDFRMGVQVHGAQAQAEYDWTARHFDAIMDGNLREYRQRNPTIKYNPYTLSAWFQARNGDLYQGTDYLRIKAWYDDPTRNTQGFDIEDAFLHSELPKSPATRLVRPGWNGILDWFANPADPGYREYSLHRYNFEVFERFAPHKADGAFLDSFETHNLSKHQLGSAEYPNSAAGRTALFTAWEEWVTLVRAHISRDGVNRRLHINSSQYWSQDGWDRRFALAAGSAHFENGQSARSAHRYFWSKIEDLASRNVVSQMLSGWDYRHYEQMTDFPRGNERSQGARGKLAELASYYMVRPGAEQIDLVRFSMISYWDAPFSEKWIRAIETDIGHPRENRRVYANGTFSFQTQWNRQWNWMVWGREYDRALVLLHSPADNDHHLYGDQTAVTVTLPAGHTWYMLSEDGTLSQTPQTQVVLRNAEAAIFVKAQP